MDIGKKIYELRKERGWTQQELAQKINVTDKAVSKWEQQLGVPDIENIINLSRIFGVTTDYLLIDTKSEKTDEEKDDFSPTNLFVTAHTHAEFLNVLLGKTYISYGRCTCPLEGNDLIWMIRLDGQTSSFGWSNNLLFADYILESFVGEDSQRLESHKVFPVNQRRYVFDIVERQEDDDVRLRHYVFMGVFELVVEKSDRDKWLWKRISSQVTLNGDIYRADDTKETHDQFVKSFQELVGDDSFKGIF